MDQGYEIGQLQARANSADQRLARIEGKLDELLERVNASHGGLQMLIWIGTIAATLGAAIVEGVHWMNK